MAETTVERRRQYEPGELARQTDPWPRWTSDFMAMSPFALARRMFDELDRSFGRMRWPESREPAEGWWPSVEVMTRGANLVVRADLPGLRKEDVKVEVTDGGLTIEGERKREQEESGRGYYRSERSYGTFCRNIPLPEGAKTDKARAQFTNGVLEVTIPVPEGAVKTHEVPIETTQAEMTSKSGR
jgi:HSP20 family protein